MGNQTIDTALYSCPARLGKVVSAIPRSIGDGFTSLHFSEEQFGGEIGPLMMVDHFIMTEPTFAPHMHVGMSVVTALFDDARGALRSRDTLGRNLVLEAGELYWLTAAMGAVHEQLPEGGARAHGLQIFVDLPDRLKSMTSHALHVRAGDVPVLEGAGYRVRVVLGVSGGVTGAQGAPQEMTMLDGSLSGGGRFIHHLPPGRHAWIYAVSGDVVVGYQDEQRLLGTGQATSVGAGQAIEISVESQAGAHFVMLAATPAR